MKKRTIRWDRLVPPGMNGRREAGQLAAGLAVGLVWNAAAFLIPFLQEYERLMWVRAAFEPFDRHLRRALIPFALLAGGWWLWPWSTSSPTTRRAGASTSCAACRIGGSCGGGA